MFDGTVGELRRAPTLTGQYLGGHKQIGTGLKRLVVAGGVGANQRLRQALNDACARLGVRVHYPELALCTDNGAMIAMAAAMRVQAGVEAPHHQYAFDVKPRWPLDQLARAAQAG